MCNILTNRRKRKLKFKITNSDPTKFFPNPYKDWPDKVHNVNSRPFKKSFNYYEHEKIQFLWQISNYIGPAPKRDMQFFPSFLDRNDYVTSEVTILTIANFLKNNPIIDDIYLPIEGDELMIFKDYYYKQVKGVERQRIEPCTIFLIYKNGKWEKGKYYYDFDETRIVHSGVLEI